MSYRPTDLSLLKGVWEFSNFEYDCNLPSEYTVQSNFSSPCLITCFQKHLLFMLHAEFKTLKRAPIKTTHISIMNLNLCLVFLTLLKSVHS